MAIDREEELQKLAALTLAPLVEIAWADGHVTAGERAGVMQAAEAMGLGQHTDFCRTTLMRWLHEPPPTEALERWRKKLAPTLAEGLTRAARRSGPRIREEARKIAKMDERSFIDGTSLEPDAGITPEEQRVLDDLDAALAVLIADPAGLPQDDR